jgi:hypothetical protein
MVYVYNLASNELRLLINNLSTSNPSDTAFFDPISYSPSSSSSSSSSSSLPYDGGEEYVDVCPSSMDQKEALIMINSLPQSLPNSNSQNPGPTLNYCDRVQLESYGIQKMGLKWYIKYPKIFFFFFFLNFNSIILCFCDIFMNVFFNKLRINRPLSSSSQSLPASDFQSPSNLSSLNPYTFPTSSSLSCAMTYFHPFIIRLFNSETTNNNTPQTPQSSFGANVMNSPTNVNNMDISIAFSLSDTPLQFITSSRLREIYLGEGKPVGKDAEDQDNKKKDKNKDKSEEVFQKFVIGGVVPLN